MGYVFLALLALHWRSRKSTYAFPQISNALDSVTKSRASSKLHIPRVIWTSISLVLFALAQPAVTTKLTSFRFLQVRAPPVIRNGQSAYSVNCLVCFIWRLYDNDHIVYCWNNQQSSQLNFYSEDVSNVKVYFRVGPFCKFSPSCCSAESLMRRLLGPRPCWRDVFC